MIGRSGQAAEISSVRTGCLEPMMGGYRRACDVRHGIMRRAPQGCQLNGMMSFAGSASSCAVFQASRIVIRHRLRAFFRRDDERLALPA
jgi:hypothetical protein